MAQWSTSTYYPIGHRVSANGNVYQATGAGTSSNAGTGPTGTGGAIADSGVTWAFQAALSAAWQATHGYTTGDVVTNDGGKLYTCIVTGTSAGSGGPTGTAGAITDGGVTWSYTASAIAQQTAPTARVGDLGLIPGAPFFAQYGNWFFARASAWLEYLNDLANEAFTWTAAHIFNAGITVSTTTAAGIAVRGSGGPVSGGSGGTGVVGLGTDGDAIGVQGIAHGAAPGVTGTGQPGVLGVGDTSTDSVGVEGIGHAAGGGGYFIAGATGAGVQGVGGATSGPGGSFTAPGGNSTGAIGVGHGSSPGVAGTGGATGAGVVGSGGATSGPGGAFAAQGGNGNGVEATGHGLGVGVLSTGGITETTGDLKIGSGVPFEVAGASGRATIYNGEATAGVGVPYIVAAVKDHAGGAGGAFLTYTPAASGVYRVSVAETGGGVGENNGEITLAYNDLVNGSYSETLLAAPAGIAVRSATRIIRAVTGTNIVIAFVASDLAATKVSATIERLI